MSSFAGDLVSSQPLCQSLSSWLGSVPSPPESLSTQFLSQGCLKGKGNVGYIIPTDSPVQDVNSQGAPPTQHSMEGNQCHWESLESGSLGPGESQMSLSSLVHIENTVCVRACVYVCVGGKKPD